MPGAPAIAPSYELHVSRSAYAGHATTEGADYWTASGFTLRSVLARLFETEERRIDLPADLDTEDRYDFVLRVPAPESHRTMERRVVEGIARHFTVSITRESRAHEVYVLTAPNGPASALRPEEPMSGGGVGFGSVEIATLTNGGHSAPDPSLEKRVSFGNLRMSGLTIGDLCRTLEEVFGRPFVDETGLAGTYELAVVGEFGDADGFFAAMRDQLGLVVAPAHRHLDVIVVRRR